MTDTEAMSDEFDVLARWTADAVRELGPAYAVPAGCQGSGSPAALRWLGAQLHLAVGATLLDVGAGLGGAAEFLTHEFAAEVVLAEPMPGACRAAVELFDRPTVCADGTVLPFQTDTFDAVSCLGVLCTMADQHGLLTELGRVLKPGCRAGLLVFVRTVSQLDRQPDGNHFPDRTELDRLLTRSGLRADAEASLDDFESTSDDWSAMVAEVDAIVERDHAEDARYELAMKQQALVAHLIENNLVRGLLLVVASGRSG